jgi:PAS domain S-box-containing protein
MTSFDTAAFDDLGGLVIVLEPGGAIVYWNRACSELTGRALDEVRGHELWELLPVPEEAARLQDAIRQLLASRRPGRLATTWALETGERRTIALSSAVAPRTGEDIELVVLTGVDITDIIAERDSGLKRLGVLLPEMFQDTSERMGAEQALRLSEERLRVSLQASPAAVFNQDLELRYTWIHSPRQPFSPEQVLGKTDFDLLPRADAEPLAAFKRNVLETGTGARTVVRTTIGGEVYYYDLTVEPLRDHTGRIWGITCATWDVTDQRRAEEEQRFLAEAGEVLLNATPDYEQTMIQLARLVVRELADWFLVDIVEAGHVRRLRIAHSDPAKAALARALEAMPLDRQRPHLMFEPLHSGHAGLVSDVSATDIESLAQSDEHLRLLRALEIRSLITMPLVARGKLLGAFALIASRDAHRYRDRDVHFIEELARLSALAVENAQLYQAAQRAIAARDEVLGIVAHDLRNPLNIVLLQSELLRSTGSEPERGNQKPADAIRRAALRMNRLIQDMLDVARLEAGSLAVERAAVATRSLLEEACSMLRDQASKAGLHLRSCAVEPLPDVFGDHDRLLQVLDNLIGNAIKFTPSGGEIVLGAEPGPGEVLFRVADTGTGVAAEHIPHLFDPFWQATKTDRRGAGLGLAIVKGLIEAHGGRIWAESEIAKGSTFYFTVPVVSRARRPV